MATKLTQDIIDSSKAAITTYISKCNEIFGTMDGEVSSLRGSGFIGDGSNGYQVFYDALKKNLKDNILEGDSALMPALQKCLDSIAEALLDTADVNIGESNKNAI